MPLGTWMKSNPVRAVMRWCPSARRCSMRGACRWLMDSMSILISRALYALVQMRS